MRKGLKRLLKKIKFHFMWDEKKSKTLKGNSGQTTQKETKSVETIIIDMSHFIYPKWNIKHQIIVNALSKKRPIKVIGFYPSRMLIWNTWSNKVLSFIEIFYNNVNRQSWLDEIYKPTFARCALDLGAFFEARKCFKSIRSKEDLVAFEYKGIIIGDLIYDTYLKWYKEPTVNVDSLKSFWCLFLAISLSRRYDNYLSNHNVQSVYLTHSVYVAYGIFARFALYHNVKVYVTQNTRGLFLQRLTKDHVHQTPRFQDYKSGFESLPEDDKPSALQLAEEGLENRLSGVVDSTIWYMRSSAYGYNDGQELRLNKKIEDAPSLLLMLHCFYDSPHIYNWMLFPDFYEWFAFVAEFCEKSGINLFVKPHPNARPGNKKIVQKLQRTYPNVTFLDVNENNQKLALSGQFSAALTVYGTVAHEFSYLGLHVINCGDNPHVSFDFCVTANSIDQYKKAIADAISREICPDKLEVKKFYYMHYFAPKPGRLAKFDKMFDNEFGFFSDYHEVISCANQLIDGGLYKDINEQIEMLELRYSEN